MDGISELTTNVLLLIIAVALMAILFATFLNIYWGTRSQLIEISTQGVCAGRIVVVGSGESGATIAFYNYGESTCRIIAAYCLDDVLRREEVDVEVPPAKLALINTTLPTNCKKYKLIESRGYEFVYD